MKPVPALVGLILSLVFVFQASYGVVREASAQTAGTKDQIEVHTEVVDLSLVTGMETLIDKLDGKRAVFVGENHDRYEDHLDELAIIKGIHAKGKDLAIGMEFFQQPFQEYLDAYVAGDISEKEMLRRTQYFDRWRFDYRLYRPILRFAREHHIPVIALNLEREITEKVGDNGLDALTDAERARIPAEIDRSDEQYRERIRRAFDQHPKNGGVSFEHFLDVQLLWDEGMAARGALYLEKHPEKSMVVLAGAGHVEYGQGIPQRLLRRVHVTSAIVLNGTGRTPNPKLADFLLYPHRVELPPSGMLGVMLDTKSAGEGIGVRGFARGSGAKAAGIEVGDRIVRIGDEPIESYSDIRIALLDGRPGEKIKVQVLREHMIAADERLTFDVDLH
ncbi:MAG: ChaN family lipoprotein [Chromatiaceae bacterium]